MYAVINEEYTLTTQKQKQTKVLHWFRNSIDTQNSMPLFVFVFLLHVFLISVYKGVARVINFFF